MDLAELSGNSVERHPWEQSRVRAIERILRGAGVTGVGSILDYGCGDAYTGRSLLNHFGADHLVGVDLHLSDDQATAFRADDPRIELVTEGTALGTRRFDLMLLCDVIEHVEDDQTILRSALRHLTERGMLLVTVPAFQALFTEHDRALRHYRRYSLSSLKTSLARAGLEPKSSGYLFGSLLLPRALQKARETVFGPREARGLGQWQGGPRLTRFLTSVLSADNMALLELSKSGIQLPGLSVWALCTVDAR
jgi:SAM-dependent methyltransferase